MTPGRENDTSSEIAVPVASGAEGPVSADIIRSLALRRRCPRRPLSVIKPLRITYTTAHSFGGLHTQRSGH